MYQFLIVLTNPLDSGLAYKESPPRWPLDGGFLKWWYRYPTTIGFPTKNDHFVVFWGYHHFRKHPYKLVKLARDAKPGDSFAVCLRCEKLCRVLLFFGRGNAKPHSSEFVGFGWEVRHPGHWTRQVEKWLLLICDELILHLLSFCMKVDITFSSWAGYRKWPSSSGITKNTEPCLKATCKQSCSPWVWQKLGCNWDWFFGDLSATLLKLHGFSLQNQYL